MNHIERNNDVFVNADDNEIFILEGGTAIEQQCRRGEK